MNTDWLLMLTGWISRIASTFLSKLLFHKYLKREKLKGEKYNLTYANSSIRFEVVGYQRSKAMTREILKILLGNQYRKYTKKRK